MRPLHWGGPQLLEAFIKATQYVVRLNAQQDIWDHLAKFLLTHFPAEWVGLVERDTGGGLSVRHCTAAEAGPAPILLTEEVRTVVLDVLDSDFLASRITRTPAPSMTAFLPVVEEGQATQVLLVGHRTTDPLPKDLLNLYLAIAGLAGATFARLRTERELDRHRAQLHGLLETLPAYVLLLAPDYHVAFANRFFRERFGASDGRRCFESLFGRTSPCERCEADTVLKTQAPLHWEWTGPDGRSYEVHGFPFTDADGSSLVMEMGIDITERKQAEEGLRRLTEELEARVRTRTAALQEANRKLEAANAQAEEANIRLEESNVELEQEVEERQAAEEALRHTHAELEQKVRERTGELSQAVERLEEQSRRLRTLAAELTRAEERERQRVATVLHDDLQQILVGAKLVLNPLTQVDDPKVQAVSREVGDLITRSLQTSRSLTEELSPPILHRGGLVPALDWLVKWMAEKYQLRVEVRTTGPVLIESHETAVLVFRVIRELLFNTAKHAKVAAATVEITERAGKMRVSVSDAGVGFDPSQLRMAGGSEGGFGLFSIRERLEYLGGGLEIESAPGKGSRFTFWLPLAPPVTRARKIRVLVVDDHRVVRQGLVRLLAEAPDIEVVGEAADGESAVAKTRELSPDVVTMDVDMPGMSGIEATRLIRACCTETRVIGLSVHEEGGQAVAMREAGAMAYLTKSAPAEELLAAIRGSGVGGIGG